MDKIYLGNTTEYGRLYLSKHSWDCGWYWGFGYIGNKNCHLHIETLIDLKWDVSQIFDKGTPITQDQWWIIRDLFIQAYALKAAAEVYQYGGHQTSKITITNVICRKEKADVINKDLELILNRVWDFLLHEVKK